MCLNSILPNSKLLIFKKMKNIQIVAVALLALFQFSCKDNKKDNSVSKESTEIKSDSIKTNLEAKNFDTIIDGKKVGLYWIENKGIKAAFYQLRRSISRFMGSR